MQLVTHVFVFVKTKINVDLSLVYPVNLEPVPNGRGRERKRDSAVLKHFGFFIASQGSTYSAFDINERVSKVGAWLRN